MHGFRIGLRHRAIAYALVIAMVLALVPEFALPIFGASVINADAVFDSGAVLIDSSYNGKTVQIKNGVFSVTVYGNVEVNLIFGDLQDDGTATGVTIDRTYAHDSKLTDAQRNIPGLHKVSQTLLNSNSNQSLNASTCPLLITGSDSAGWPTVHAGFLGSCRFYAGTNGGTVTSGNSYNPAKDGNGFAGIQVDRGATLTVEFATDLRVFGAHQYAIPDEKGNITAGNNNKEFFYSDVLRANANINSAGYDDPYDTPYGAPDGAESEKFSGGAGIGGGATLTRTSSSSTSYTLGTPGTIIINNGTIETFGGHQSAGIGGAVNSTAAADGKMIQINGGTITAHGGRWAAGIGDGDSVYSARSTVYSANNLIEINGGTVTSYGGVGSPGIGSADELADISNMQININGGTVYAFSGFPDKFDGNYSTSKPPPAAIGAGSSTTMDDNSIYISSASVLRCAGFGNYSLTENGTANGDVPTINVDSDGYLLLLRTDEYHSVKDREFKLYLPQIVTMEVDSDGNGELDLTTEAYIYTDQTQRNSPRYYVVHSDNEADGKVFDENGRIIVDPPETLTLLVDENSEELKEYEIDFSYYFRSIALTLPHPEDLGGIYALNIPKDGISGANVPQYSDAITLTIDAREQGTQSGAVEFPSRNNLNSDATSAPLTDLDVDGNATTDGLIGEAFRPRVFAYTVYVEPNATEADIYLAFDTVSNTTYQLYRDSSTSPFDTVKDSTGNYSCTLENVQLTGDRTVVQIKKQDTQGTVKLSTISYKITIIKKGDYGLELSDPSKVYDGQPVHVTATGAYSGTMYSIKENPATENGAGTTLYGDDVNSVNGKSVVPIPQYTAQMRVQDWYSSSLARILAQGWVVPSNTPGIVYYYLHVKVENEGGYVDGISANGYLMGWQVDYTGNTASVTRLNSRIDPSGVTDSLATNNNWISTGGVNIASYSYSSFMGESQTGYISLSTSDTGTVTLSNSGNVTRTLFSFQTATRTRSSSTGDKDKVEASVIAQAKNGNVGYKETYTITNESEWTHTVTTNAFYYVSYGYGNGGYTNNNSNRTVTVVNRSELTGSFEVLSSGGNYEAVTLPPEDLEQAVITYQRTHNAYGEMVAEGFTSTAPTDAGTYVAKAVLKTTTYNAEGYRTFQITQRPVTVVQIQNWLLYTKEQPTGDIPITDPGKYTLSNVVSGDILDLDADAEHGKVYYNSPTVSYGSDKISIIGAWLIGEDKDNYKLVYYNEANFEIRVFGQISYDMSEAIFRKEDDAEDGTEKDWRKHYPTDDSEPMNDQKADYHSPAETDPAHGQYLSHAEYVKARTLNKGVDEARYCVDLEYGPMQFYFYRGVWNVNDLKYEDLPDSLWTGNDGTNNKLSVINYSNELISYQMTVELNFLGTGIAATLSQGADGSIPVASGTWTDVAAATAGDKDSQGTASVSDRYLTLSRVPQMGNTDGFVSVGTITVLLSPTAGGS